VIHELDMVGVESEVLAAEVLAESKRKFPSVPPMLFMDAGDRAGAQVGEKGPGPIIRLGGPPFFLQIKNKWCNIEPGLELVRKMLTYQCACGLPGMMIDRECINTIEGFCGGYHYARKMTQSPKEVPFKDKFFDDFMDTIRYVGENCVRIELLGSGFMDQLMANEPLNLDMDQMMGDRNEWMDKVPYLIG
jgi:hypothetical protein